MSNKTVQIAHNAVTAMIRNASDDLKIMISSLMSYQVEGYEHTDAHKNGDWDGTSTFFEYNTGKFPVGFLFSVESRLRKMGYTVQKISRPIPEPLGPEIPIVDDFGFDPRYDYQLKCVNRLVQYRQMIAQIATGGGKSRVAKMCYQRIQRPTLFMTTRKALLYQMKKHFEEMGLKVGVIGDNKFSPGAQVTVGMVQTISKRLNSRPTSRKAAAVFEAEQRRDEMLEYLHSVEFLIGEEAHEASGEGYYDVTRACKNAHYRLALTATPFMKTDAEANMRLLASFGVVGIKVPEKMLIDRGILAKPYFKFIDCPAPPKLYKTTPWHRARKFGIVENSIRNKHICAEAIRAARMGLSVLILVQSREHGRILKDIIKGVGVRCDYIFGDSDREKRAEAFRAIESGELQVLIGSTIVDVGVDVPGLGMIIMAGGGKAEVNHRQRIGRGLRAKKNGPNICLVIDFLDLKNKILKSHAYTRKQIVLQTPGFGENILPKDTDFDFVKLGLRARAA